MLSEFLKTIEEYLKSKITDVSILATPQQLFAGSTYDMLNYSKCVLINAEYSDFQNLSKTLEPGDIAYGLAKQNIKINMSIGVKNLNHNFDLEDLVERVIEEVSFIHDANYSPLVPLLTSQTIIDANSVTWKTVSFSTFKMMRKSPENVAKLEGEL